VPQLDTNVFLRFLLKDHDVLSPRATEFFRKLNSGQVTVDLGEISLFEVVFTLHRQYKRGRTEIAETVSDFISHPSVRFPQRDRALTALSIFDSNNVDFGDAYIAALALESDGRVISFDRDFDRIPGLTRVEP
jgi:predicted nucleic acid-binding protein